MELFSVSKIEPLVLDAQPPLSEAHTMSPYVWQTPGGYSVMVRAVSTAADAAGAVSAIYYGESTDGLRFHMDKRPVIAPGKNPSEQDGCEDPTVVHIDDRYYVYYTGWNWAEKRGELMLADGPDVHHLRQRGIRLPSTDRVSNPKEATLVQTRDGSWRLFFEFAADGKSKIGVGASRTVDGPWMVEPPLMDARPDKWDNWHLSTGPILTTDNHRPIMFYNGATHDAVWRIGWIMFDAQYLRVLDRCDGPIFTPVLDIAGETDIAFAASVIQENGNASLYYSVGDQEMRRATLHRR
ncbi:MAG TPA: hypothetical protein VGM51_11445 [Armatimonadota bacterium]